MHTYIHDLLAVEVAVALPDVDEGLHHLALIVIIIVIILCMINSSYINSIHTIHTTNNHTHTNNNTTNNNTNNTNDNNTHHKTNSYTTTSDLFVSLSHLFFARCCVFVFVIHLCIWFVMCCCYYLC